MDAKKPVSRASIVQKDGVRSLKGNNSNRKEIHPRLKLNEEAVRPQRTRGEMFKKLNEAIPEEDFFETPSPIGRFLAFVIDTAVLIGVGLFLFEHSPRMAEYVANYLKENPNITFIIEPNALKFLTFGISTFLFVFFFQIIPTSFLNVSLGKKIFGLNVRGEESYSLSLGQALLRELIFKPLSVALLIGLILPFFDKEKQRSLHDRICKTYVVKA